MILLYYLKKVNRIINRENNKMDFLNIFNEKLKKSILFKKSNN